MADDKKSTEAKEEVVSFFRRALEEVVDFTEAPDDSPKTDERKSLPKSPEKVRHVEKKAPEPQKQPEPERKTKPDKEPERGSVTEEKSTQERQYLSRRERKEAELARLPEPIEKAESPVRFGADVRRPEKSKLERRDRGDNPMKKKLAVIAAVLCISVITACAFLGGGEPEPKVVDDTPMYIRIPAGMGAGSIGDLLEEKQVISSSKYFLKRLRKSGRDGEVQSGTYKVHKGMKSDEVIDILVNGRVAALRFTIPEGYSLNEMAKSLEKDGICKGTDFLKAARTYKGLSYAAASPDIEIPVEGYLFPDTYEVPPDATAEDIVDLMARTFDERLTDDMRAAAQKYGLSIHEFVTLASLVEKEVMDDEDRPKVAQVFLKRLEIEMPIQSCATIQYLLKEPKEDLTFDDLKIESPYNTYENPGLPPGPIASPGEKALEAAAHPSATNYLYFVADRKGKTYYSETFDEHMEKVEKYR